MGSPPLGLASDFGSVTAAQVAAADAAAVRGGMAADLLMQAAGAQVARFTWQRTGGNPVSICVVAGPGNNGGDGLVAARWLATWGYRVRVVVLADTTRWRLASLLAPLQNLGVGCRVDVSAAALLPGAERPDLVIDGLLGTGARGELRPDVLTLTDWASDCDCISIDLPTGVDADTGEISGGAIAATATCTLAAVKRGLWCPEARRRAGDLWVADIGMPAFAWQEAGVPPPPKVRGGELLSVPAFTD